MSNAAKRHLVLTAVASDRPGLVALIADYVALRGGNVEDSRMVILGGEFGALVLVSGSEDVLGRIERDADQLRRSAPGCDLLLRRTQSPSEHRRGRALPCIVTAESLDREGIVRAVSTALERLGVNIVSLETTCSSAPFSGSPLFHLEAHIDLPESIALSALRSELSEVGSSENLDIEVHAKGRGGDH